MKTRTVFPAKPSLPSQTLAVAYRAAKSIAGLPFDAARAQYASAVQAGFLRNSMLASRAFERTLGALERATLGPLARSAAPWNLRTSIRFFCGA